LSVPKPPKNGWVRSIREALGMSGAQLGERLNLSRNQVSILERKETDETITLKQLKQLASGLDAELVYAIIPRQSIDDMVEARAMELAKQR
ncbi:helix-turn-helix domain-containing protein, partial [Vibrio anguillarum]|uniref:helix-turn-helix domain-containing protein n=1 Tax=Vibrio anguillarum TaxID=55601 RepID=UPI00188A8A47